MPVAIRDANPGDAKIIVAYNTAVALETEGRRRVFSALYRHVEALARQDPGCCGILLYVEHENQRAQQTYLALGMLKPGYDVMEVDFRKEAIQEQESSNA